MSAGEQRNKRVCHVGRLLKKYKSTTLTYLTLLYKEAQSTGERGEKSGIKAQLLRRGLYIMTNELGRKGLVDPLLLLVALFDWP